MKIETAEQLVDACKKVAGEKTLYVYGAFGLPLNEKNRERVLKSYAYNRTDARRKKIEAAAADTFGFDCSGLIKGLLWGWCGEIDANYGGAIYGSNGVQDQNADTIIANCREVSQDFSDLRVGEAVWLPGHIGVYIGDGLAVEATPKWADGVQITACNCQIDGYKTRTWQKHGCLPWIRYESSAVLELPVLSRGVQGSCVVGLQRILHGMGYPIGNKNPLDGNFGPKVESAVRMFQQEHDLPVTGQVDESTWKKLLGV